MLTVAYCRDAQGARTARERFYDAHIKYLQSVQGDIRFAGPLAGVDDAQVLGDERLAGSLFVFGLAFPAAQAAILADPYMKGNVWESVDLFEAREASGPWIQGHADTLTRAPLYAALAHGEGEMPTGRGYLLTAALRRGLSVGKPGERSWSGVALFTAATLTDARALLGLAATSAPAIDARWEVWAVPLSTGSWTRDSRDAGATL